MCDTATSKRFLLRSKLRSINRQNRKDMDHLSLKTWEEVDNLFGALRRCNINEYDAALIRRDLIGLAREAEQRGETLAQALGEDPVIFCQKLAENGRPKTKKEKNLAWLNWVLSCTIFFHFLLGGGLVPLYYLLHLSTSPTLPMTVEITVIFLLAHGGCLAIYTLFYFFPRNRSTGIHTSYLLMYVTLIVWGLLVAPPFYPDASPFLFTIDMRFVTPLVLFLWLWVRHTYHSYIAHTPQASPES